VSALEKDLAVAKSRAADLERSLDKQHRLHGIYKMRTGTAGSPTALEHRKVRIIEVAPPVLMTPPYKEI
jgi:hypothetical protein